MAEPLSPTPQDVTNSEQQISNLDAIVSRNQNLLDLSRQIGNSETTNKLISVMQASEAKKITDSYVSQIAQLRKVGTISKEQATSLKIQAKLHADNTVQAKAQATALQMQSTALKVATDEARKKLGIYKEQLMTQRQIEESARRTANEEARAAQAAKNENAIKYINKAGAVGGQIHNISGGAAEAGIQAGAGALGNLIAPGIGGVVGENLAKIGGAIGKWINKYEIMAAGLTRSMAQTGDFQTGAKNLSNMTKQMENFQASLGSGRTSGGLNLDQVTSKMNELASSGIRLSPIFTENAKKVDQLNAVSLSLGVSVGQLGATLTSFRRTLKGGNDEVAVANQLSVIGNQVVKADIMSQQEFIGLASQAADVFSEMNFSVDKTIDLVGDLSLTIKKMGVTGKVASEITRTLTNSFKATSDEWKAFAGAKSGAGGGFLGGLFSAQQRGPGGDLLERQQDPKIWLQQMMTTIKGQTSGIADPRAKMYMAETMGKNFGLDAKGTQALLRGVMGNSTDQAKALDDLLANAKDVEEKSRDWTERLSDLLNTWAAKWLTPFVTAIEKLVEFLKNPAKGTAKAAAGAMVGAAKSAIPLGASLISPVPTAAWTAGNWAYDKIKSPNKQKAEGGEIYATEPIIAHMGEEVLSPNKAREYRANRGREGQGGSAINIKININNGDIDKAFEKAKQDTKRQLKKSNAVAWGM